MNVLKIKHISFAISTVLVVTSIVLLATFGLKPGIDFTGGSLLEVSFTQEAPVLEDMQALLADEKLGLEEFTVQPVVDNNGYIIKTTVITDETRKAILEELRAQYETVPVLQATVNEDGVAELDASSVQEGNKVFQERVDIIGPSISSHLRSRALYAGIAVVLAIVAFIAYAFRKVSRPIQSWKYGITAIVALLHDVIITMGVFAVLGHVAGVEVGIQFVVALLTILGYSVNDTIVVFDRVRENLMKKGPNKFEEAIEEGVRDTIPRSINTSLTTLAVLFALYAFGGDSIHYFSLALLVGIALGTYSSIFLASPLLTVWKRK